MSVHIARELIAMSESLTNALCHDRPFVFDEKQMAAVREELARQFESADSTTVGALAEALASDMEESAVREYLSQLAREGKAFISNDSIYPL